MTQTKTYTFYSYKGGVGRSLLLLNFASFLLSSGKKVFILDLDIEAPGLDRKDDMRALFLDPNGSAKGGVIEYAEACKAVGDTYTSLADYVCDCRVSREDYTQFNLHSQTSKLWFMAAGANGPSAKYMLGLDRLLHDNMSPYYGSRYPFYDRIYDLQRRIKLEYQPDFLLIDARTGLSDFSKTAMGRGVDHLICMFLDNSENKHAARNLLPFFTNVGEGQFDVVPVVTRINSRERVSIQRKWEEIVQTSGISQGPFLLSNDSQVQDIESVLFSSACALRDSYLIRDYLRLFGGLEPDLARSSRYQEFNGEVNRIERLDKKLGHGDYFSHSTERSDKDSPTCKQPKYITWNYFQPTDGLQSYYYAFVDEVARQIMDDDSGCKLEPEPISQVDTNLIPFYLYSGRNWISRDPYFLSAYRRLAVDVLPFGKLSEYVCIFGKEIESKHVLEGFDETPNVTIQRLLREIRPQKVYVHGDTASATEVVEALGQHSNPQIDCDGVFSEQDIIERLRSSSEKREIVFCDFGVWERVKSKNSALRSNRRLNLDLYKRLSLRYKTTIPVGFMLSQRHAGMRAKVARAIKSVICDPDFCWSRICKELKGRGIEPLSFDDLKRIVAFDLPWAEARDFLMGGNR